MDGLDAGVGLWSMDRVAYRFVPHLSKKNDQVEELVLHRCPALLDEVVPTLIAAFQVLKAYSHLLFWLFGLAKRHVCRAMMWIDGRAIERALRSIDRLTDTNTRTHTHALPTHTPTALNINT